MISRLVVDHIVYLTAISLLGYSLKTAIDHLLQLHVTSILVKLRPDSFFNKIILYCIVILYYYREPDQDEWILNGLLAKAALKSSRKSKSPILLVFGKTYSRQM